MTSTLYVLGLEQWPDLNDTDYRWLLLDDTYTPTQADQYVADLTGELTDGSYARQTLTGAAITFGTNALGDCVRYDADTPTWAALAGATDVAWVVLAREVTTDADSPLLAVWAVAWNPTGADFAPVVPVSGLHEHNVVTDAFWPAS